MDTENGGKRWTQRMEGNSGHGEWRETVDTENGGKQGTQPSVLKMIRKTLILASSVWDVGVFAKFFYVYLIFHN